MSRRCLMRIYSVDSLQSGQSADEFVKHFADICFDCLIRRQSTSASFSKDLWGMSICESQRHVNLPVFFGDLLLLFGYFVFFLSVFQFMQLCNFSFWNKNKVANSNFHSFFFSKFLPGFYGFKLFQKKTSRHPILTTNPPTHQAHPKDV